VLRLADNAGFAAGANRALAAARGRFVLLLDSDARPLPGAIARCLAHLEAHPDVGVVSPLLLRGRAPARHRAPLPGARERARLARSPRLARAAALSLLALASGRAPSPKRAAIGESTTTNAAVGPDTWKREPPSSEIAPPATIAV